MEVKTFEQFAIWLGMQFPVAAFCCFCVWYTIRWTDRKHTQELQRADAERDRQLAEKDKLIALQNAIIDELKAESEKLMVLRYPTWGKSPESGGAKP